MTRGFLPQNYPELYLAAAGSHTKRLSRRKPEFRVSSLPFCPILHYLGNIAPDRQEFSYERDYYMDMGTALHALIQQAMIYTPIFGKSSFGRWVCPNREKGCGTLVAEPCTRPSSPKCNRKDCLGVWRYEELDFRYKGLSGHLDFLSLDGKLWWAWEFKTAGWYALRGPGLKKLPYRRHIIQIETYCALLELQYGIRVHGFTICYIPRENPRIDSGATFRFEWKGKRRERAFRRLRVSFRRHRTYLKAMEAFNQRIVPDFTAMLEARPCKSHADFKRKMSPAFFKGECVFKESGECACKSSKKMMKVLVEETQLAFRRK